MKNKIEFNKKPFLGLTFDGLRKKKAIIPYWLSTMHSFGHGFLEFHAWEDENNKEFTHLRVSEVMLKRTNWHLDLGNSDNCLKNFKKNPYKVIAIKEDCGIPFVPTKSGLGSICFRNDCRSFNGTPFKFYPGLITSLYREIEEEIKNSYPNCYSFAIETDIFLLAPHGDIRKIISLFRKSFASGKDNLDEKTYYYEAW